MTRRGCCGGGSSPPPSLPERKIEPGMNDSDIVRVRYLSLNKGSHQVVGPARFGQPFPDARMIRVAQGAWSFDYGHHSAGDEFDVHRADLEIAPQLFQEITTMPFQEPPQRWSPPPPPPEPLSPWGPTPKTLDLQDEAAELLRAKEERGFVLDLVPGITPRVADQMKADGVNSEEEILALGEEGLQKYKGVGENKARVIIDWLRRKR